eukprot:SAG11_NODE_94_length_17057_cov_255.471754_4_plen_81_part_00
MQALQLQRGQTRPERLEALQEGGQPQPARRQIVVVQPRMDRQGAAIVETMETKRMHEATMFLQTIKTQVVHVAPESCQLP